MFILDVLVTILLVGAGGYALAACIRLKREQVLFENKILYPSQCTPENCLDPEGYIAYIENGAESARVTFSVGGGTLPLDRLYATAVCRQSPVSLYTLHRQMKKICTSHDLPHYMRLQYSPCPQAQTQASAM